LANWHAYRPMAFLAVTGGGGGTCTRFAFEHGSRVWICI